MMLDFSFTAREEEYRQALRKIALEEFYPLYQQSDDHGTYPHEQVQRALSFANDFWQGHEDERNLIVCGITAEEIARGDFNVVLMSLGPQYQRYFLGEAPDHLTDEWLPRLSEGKAIIGLGITEPGAGSDMGAMAATAVKDGDDVVLNGVKNSVSFLNADIFYVFARSDPDASGYRGISAYLVPRDTPGLEFETVEDMGCRAVPRGVLKMNDARVPAGNRIGEEGMAFPMISKFFDINRAIIGLKCIGAALQSIDETVAYTAGREQFGRPLSSNQGVSFALAEALTHLEMARWLCYKVLWMRQNEIACQYEGAMVKWYAPKMAVEAIQKCMLLHGHKGYSKELPIQQRLRDVIGWQIGDGSEEVMKLIIARSMFGRER